MTDIDPGPIFRRRQVGTRLRGLREAARKSLDDVATYLECSAAKISRIETGRLPARVPDVRHMLDLYGVTGSERDEVLDLVRQSRRRGWWQDFPDALVSDGYETFLGLQDAAATICWYEPYLVPGLLQTRAYAHAVFAPQEHLTETQVDRMTELRMTNQEAVLRRPRPPRAHFLLDEAVLHRGAGSPMVMREQFTHIVDLVRQGQVTVQIVPFSAGFTPAYGTPFVLFGFHDPADPRVVYVEQLFGSHFQTKLDTVNRYGWIADNLRSVALPAERTVAHLADLARQPD